ncbi:MAG: hypothetical protein QXI33_02480 [Candidatus Pacearchaeota archaeon]
MGKLIKIIDGMPIIDIRRDGEIKEYVKISKENKKEQILKLTRALKAASDKLAYDFDLISGLQHNSTILWLTQYNLPEEEGFPEVAISKITLCGKASYSDKILQNSYYSPYGFRIIEGGNSLSGVNKKTQRFNLTLFADRNKGPWDSYDSFSEDFYRYSEKFNPKKILGEIADYVIMLGRDPASEQKILVELGQLPIPKKNLLDLVSDIIPRKIFKEY